MADEPYASFRAQLEHVVDRARAELSATDRELVCRLVRRHRAGGTPVVAVRIGAGAPRAVAAAGLLCALLAYVDTELPDRAAELERVILAGLSRPVRTSALGRTRAAVTLATAAVALFATFGLVPELLGDWPYNAFGKNSRTHAAHVHHAPLHVGAARVVRVRA